MTLPARILQLLFNVLFCGAMLSLVACEEAPSPMDHSDHAYHQHHEVSTEPNDTTLEAIISENAGQTLPYFNSESFTPIWLEPGSAELEGFHHIPEFAFINQAGQRISSKEYEGKIYVATFFFTTCPGICPMLNQRLLTVQNAVSEFEDVRILSHSITPQIDTVEALRAYAEEKGIDSGTWDLVTGERDAIYAVAKEGYFASEDMGESQALGDFNHTENVLLIDKDGRIRGIYNGLSRNAVLNIIADIELLRVEQPVS